MYDGYQVSNRLVVCSYYYTKGIEFDSEGLPYVVRVAVVVTEILGCKLVMFEVIRIHVVKN